jgi:hypothetical protein
LPAKLEPLIEPYQLLRAKAGLGRGRSDSLMLTLPSPISRRLDFLVEQLRVDYGRVFRQDVVGALIMTETPKDAGQRLFPDYRAYAKARG